jgi:hypothetical protein
MAAAKEDTPVEVIIRDPNIPKAPFEQAEVKVRSHQNEDEGKSALPSKAAVDEMLEKSGISVAKWDQVDRDFFILTVKTNSIEEVSKRYPKIEKSQIQNLRKLLEKTESK